ncbi:unnamed protein product [Amaranthus hypochondriacus]
MTSLTIPTTLTLTLLLLSLFSFSHTTPTTATSADNIFRDINGNPVINGGRYVIRRNMMAPDAGSLTWKNTTKSCPLYIVEGYWPISLNDFNPPAYTSVTIQSPLKSLFIPLKSPIQITFNDPNTPCKNPLKWSVKPIKSSSIIDAFYLVAGYNNPRYNGHFKVRVSDSEMAGDYVYRLEYCLESQKCLEVGESNEFPDSDVFGVSSDANVKVYPLDVFVVLEDASSATSI